MGACDRNQSGPLRRRVLVAVLAAFCAAPSSAQAQVLSDAEIELRWNRAVELRREHKYAEAATLWEHLVPAIERAKGKDSEMAATALAELAFCHDDGGDPEKAAPFLLRSLKIKEAALGKDNVELAGYVNSLGTIYRRMRDYGQAEPHYRRALEVRQAKLGTDHALVASSLNNLAGLFEEMGEHRKAESHYRASLQILEAQFKKERPDPALARTLHNLASLYELMGRLATAEPLYLRSLQIYEISYGADAPIVGQTVLSIGHLYRSMGQYEKAAANIQRGVRILESKLGKDHPFVGAAHSQLGALYRWQREFAKAEPYYRSCLRIHQAKLGDDHPDAAQALAVLARLYIAMGEFAKAEPMLLHSLKVFEDKFGADHPRVAEALGSLGELHRGRGDFAKAAALFERSLRIRQEKLSKDHPDTTNLLGSLAGIAAGQKDWTRAIDYGNKVSQALVKHVAEVLPSLSEAEQLSYLKQQVESEFHWLLSLGWATRAEAGAAVSAEWLLNTKALAYQTLAEQQILARDSKNSQTRELGQELQQARARLAALHNRVPRPGRESAFQKELRDLKDSEQKLAEKLARAVGRAFRSNPWITIDDLRTQLGDKTVFVDIARFSLGDFATGKQVGPRYAAWITPPKGKGDVQLIDLGDAETIDRLAEQARKLLLESALSITKEGEAQAATAAQKPLRDLSARVLDPLLKAIEGYEEWIVCPDSELWLTPWSAFVLPDGKFVVEKHLVRHMVSGRDLVLGQPKHKTESAHLFADPDYDLSPTNVADAAGVRGLSSPLLGRRLPGVIGAWNVSFEFGANEVVIYDEDNRGAVAGKGTWRYLDEVLTIQTGISTFQAPLTAGEFRGQRSRRNPDGSVMRDTFRIDAEAGDFRSAVSTARKLPRVQRLPGTAAEADLVGPKIELWLGHAPKVYLEALASEAKLKSVKNPRVLALATHGYFLATQYANNGRTAREPGEKHRPELVLDKTGAAIENPFLRCGLLLAGCNKSAEAKPGEDDGILTGLEIVGMDLRGTELVVLSACETGLGDVRSGEGVAGLRQAFQLAGAKGVLASLWQVPDRETAMLMNGFYGELTKGRNQAAALREAQLSRIAARRSSFGAAHPFFWAAFTLTGRGGD